MVGVGVGVGVDGRGRGRWSRSRPLGKGSLSRRPAPTTRRRDCRRSGPHTAHASVNVILVARRSSLPSFTYALLQNSSQMLWLTPRQALQK